MTLDNQSVMDSLKHGDYYVLKRIYRETRQEFNQWAFAQYKIPLSEAEEIFQTTVIIFYEKMSRGTVELSSHWKTYLFAIGKNKIREYLRSLGKSIALDDLGEGEPFEIPTDDKDAVDEQTVLVIKCIEELGQSCKELIMAFYYQKMALDEISARLGYKNAYSAKNQKFKCMQRLKELFIKQYRPL